MSKQKEGLNDAQKRFCEEYVYDFNGTRSYQAAYPKASYETAMVEASKFLRIPKIEAYIDQLKGETERLAGISRLMVANELKKIATSTISDIHNTWIDRKDFEQLPKRVKDCIQEIDTRITKRIGEEDEIFQVEQIKVKFYSKAQALIEIKKMFGYDAPEKLHQTGDITVNVIREKLPSINER